MPRKKKAAKKKAVKVCRKVPHGYKLKLVRKKRAGRRKKAAKRRK